MGRVPVLWVIHGYRDPWPTLQYYLLYRNRTLSFISLQLVSRPMIFSVSLVEQGILECCSSWDHKELDTT